MVKQKLSITLDEDLIKIIDEQRESMPVSPFIEERMRESLKKIDIKDLTLKKCDEIIALIDSSLNPRVPIAVRTKVLSPQAEISLRTIREKVLELKVLVLS